MGDAKILEIYQDRLSYDIVEPEAMMNTDRCDFPNKGKASIGVHH